MNKSTVFVKSFPTTLAVAREDLEMYLIDMLS